MNKIDYDRFRLLEFIQKRKQITRGNLTREGLGRLKCDMKDLKAYIRWGLANGYLHQYTEHIPGKKGMPALVYTVKPAGNKWLRDMRLQAKRELEGLR